MVEDGVFPWAFIAAARLADPALLPSLARYDETNPEVAEALKACTPPDQIS